MCDKTMTFSVTEEREVQMKQTLTTVYDALTQKGYNPINQIVGYILSEDPTYITTYNNARNLIRHIDRDELLQVLVKSYLMHWFSFLKQNKKDTFAQRTSCGMCLFFLSLDNYAENWYNILGLKKLKGGSRIAAGNFIFWRNKRKNK